MSKPTLDHFGVSTSKQNQSFENAFFIVTISK